MQVRSLAAGVIAAMAEQEDARGEPLLRLDPELADVLFARMAFDNCPEVRARVAEIAGYVADFRCLPLLQLLSDDPEWFVRLHAVRALARHRPTSLNAISAHLTDSEWHVREAAAQALCTHGRAGVHRLLEHFATTEDRYSQEQIAEQISRAGVLPALLENLDGPDCESERRFVERMVRIGKGEVLLAAIASNAVRKDSAALLSAFSLDPNLTAMAVTDPHSAGAQVEAEPGRLTLARSGSGHALP